MVHATYPVASVMVVDVVQYRNERGIRVPCLDQLHASMHAPMATQYASKGILHQLNVLRSTVQSERADYGCAFRSPITYSPCAHCSLVCTSMIALQVAFQTQSMSGMPSLHQVRSVTTAVDIPRAHHLTTIISLTVKHELHSSDASGGPSGPPGIGRPLNINPHVSPWYTGP